MTSVTIASLRAEIYELLDVTGTSTTSDARVNDLIKRKLSKVRSMIIGVDESYFMTTVTLTLSANTNTINLASSAVIPASVRVQQICRIYYDDGTYYYEVPEIKLNDYAFEYNEISSVDGTSLKWFLRGDKLVFNGTPSSDISLKMWYIPVFYASMSSSALLGWKVPFDCSDVVVYGVCADMRERSEEDPSYFNAKYQEAKQELFENVFNRTLTSDNKVWDAFNRWQ